MPQFLTSFSDVFFNPDTEQSLLLLLFKLLFVLTAFLYVLFSVVVIRQISIMRRTLITPFSPMLSVLGWIHALFAVFVLFIFVIIL